MEKEKCVACGNLADGRYGALPVCLECYTSERLKEYLEKEGGK